MAYPPSPATFIEFMSTFGSREACIEYLARWRWPDGFVCPHCSGTKHYFIRTRQLWECALCRRQTSVTAGTALHQSKVPLQVWVYAMWLLGRRKKGISAAQLQRETGLGSYRTAWRLLHKVRKVLRQGDAFPLERDEVEVDETILGGRDGAAGRRLGRDGALLAVAVERREVRRNGRSYLVSGDARAAVIPDATGDTLMAFVGRAVAPGATLVTDGWYGYRRAPRNGYDHVRYDLKGIAKRIGGSRKKLAPHFLPKVHLFISNLKTWLTGTFHGVSAKYLQAYVDEFVYRFGRRHREDELFGFIARRLLHSPWTPVSALLPERGA